MKLFIYFNAFQPFLAFGPFSKCTETCGPIIHFLVFMSVFGIRPIFEIHRDMWPGYTFFSFSRAFLALGQFSKYTEVCGPVIHFSRFHEHFFAFVGFKLFLAFCQFSKCTETCGFFLISCATSRKLSK